jgi:hypothetical protein
MTEGMCEPHPNQVAPAVRSGLVSCHHPKALDFGEIQHFPQVVLLHIVYFGFRLWVS